MMTADQHRARAEALRQVNPESRAAAIHDMVANVIDVRGEDDPELDKLITKYRKRLTGESA